MKRKQVYLDYAAATPLSREVFLAMEPFFSEQFYNPSALYMPARQVKHALDDARADVARTIGARPGEIIFTAGGTESANLAIHGIMRRFSDKVLLVSSIEHEAVLQPARHYIHRLIPVDVHGTILLDGLKEQVSDDTVLISVMYANNEVGTIQPLQAIAELISGIKKDRKQRNIDTPLYFHTDACQAAGYLDLHVDRLGIDLMTLNGGKIYGPKQSGALFMRAGITLHPLIDGGGQERGLRSGTESAAACVGFSVALKAAQGKAAAERKRLHNLQQYVMKTLREKFPDVVIHGHFEKRLPNNVSFALPGIDNERLMMLLDEKDFLVATGSACSASEQAASHVLTAMGVDEAVARSTIRLSFGVKTDEESLKDFLTALEESVSEIKQLFR